MKVLCRQGIISCNEHIHIVDALLDFQQVINRVDDDIDGVVAARLGAEEILELFKMAFAQKLQEAEEVPYKSHVRSHHCVNRLIL